MFETWSLLALQQYWYIIISILAAALVFLMFVQGGQTLLYQIGKTDDEQTMLINTLGRKWELSFTTLVTFGGAFFASFPLFYATSFGGAYWVWMFILFGYIIQAVSYEFRRKSGNTFGKRTYEAFLVINGLLSTVLIGTAVGTFFTGSDFSLNAYNLSRWEHPARGLEAALNIQNISLGFAVFFLSRILGALYFINTIDNKSITDRANHQVKVNSVLFLLFFLTFLILTLFGKGFAVNPENNTVFLENYKYLNNLLAMPVILIFLLVGVVLVLYGIWIGASRKRRSSFWYVGTGTILVVFSLFIVAGFNNTAFYPSTFDLQSSLTIKNASSSHYTLTAMSYVSLFVPVVVAYIWYVWRSINKKQITQSEINEGKDKGEHIY